MSKKRRGRGEGGLSQRTEDGLWMATVCMGYELKDGRWVRKTRRITGKKKPDVQKKLMELQAAVANGTLADSGRVTLAQFLSNWMEACVKPSVKPTTFVDYESLIRTHINPTLGGFPLAKLTPESVQLMYLDMQKQGRSPNLVRKVHAVLHKALNQAVMWRKVTRNVTDAVQKPKMVKHKFRVLDEDEAIRLLAAVRDDRLYALYALAISAGLRQGELFALTWENLSLKDGRLSVVNTLIELNGKHQLGAPKSESSRRSVLLSKFAVDALRAHRVRMLAEGNLGRWVFCDTEGNHLRKSNFTRRSFKPALSRAGLPDIRFHDLRHTAATLLLKKDVPAKVVQELLGHSSITLTLDTYSHVLPCMQEHAASRMDEVFVGSQASGA